MIFSKTFSVQFQPVLPVAQNKLPYTLRQTYNHLDGVLPVCVPLSK